MTAKKKQRLPEGIRLLSSGRYQARYPVDQPDGTRKQVSAGTFRTLADAKDARSVQIAMLRNGGWVDPAGPKMTVADWASRWQELRRANDRRTTSFLAYRIVPHFGARKLGDITPIDVQMWVNSLVAEGLAPGTVRSMYTTFKAMFARAVDYDVIAKTPCRRIELPKAVRSEPVPLSVETLHLLERTAPARFAAMIHLAAWAGLRWGECAALRWENVDLENGVVHVREAVKDDKTVGLPKGDKTRDVDISPTTVDVLRAHRRDFGLTALLFTGERDKRQLDYASFRHHTWRTLIDACGLEPRPTFHDLRHAYAAHMRRAGLDPDILTDLMGHHSNAFNQDTYGWKRADHRQVTVATIEAAQRGE